MQSEFSWWVEELGGGRNKAVTGSTQEGGGKRRLAWRVGDACAMNQLSKYGLCSSLQHTHPLPLQSAWILPLLQVHLSLLLSHIYYSNLSTQYVFLSAYQSLMSVAEMCTGTFWGRWVYPWSSQSLSLNPNRM